MQRKIEFKVGEIQEILNGDGTPTENPQAVYDILDKPGEIYIPRVTGVYQTDPFIQIEELENQIRALNPRVDIKEIKEELGLALRRIEENFIRRLKKGSLSHDRLPPNLISILYDGSACQKRDIQIYLGNRDPNSRITIYEGLFAPNFSEKMSRNTSHLNGQAIKSLFNKELDKYRPKINKHIEEMRLDKENYGLTLVELSNLLWIENLIKIKIY